MNTPYNVAPFYNPAMQNVRPQDLIEAVKLCCRIPKKQVPPSQWHIHAAPDIRRISDKPSPFEKIPSPPSHVDVTKPYFVMCYQTKQQPYYVAFMGVCPPGKTNLRVKDLLSEVPEEVPEGVPAEPILMVVSAPTIQAIPDFFVYIGRPKLPENVCGNLFMVECDKFWKWMKSYQYPSCEITPNPANGGPIDPQVLFFMILWAMHDKPEYMLTVYGYYLKKHFATFIPDSETRIRFAEVHKLQLSGHEEVEQKVLSIARVEAAILRD
jgi:hypothetical protein